MEQSSPKFHPTLQQLILEIYSHRERSSQQQNNSSPNQNGADLPKQKRRSPRVSVKIPIVLRGYQRSGQEFEEVTETLTISKHGAGLITVHDLDVGSFITLRLKEKETLSRGRVAWVGKAENGAANRIGIEFLEDNDFFITLNDHFYPP